jgi:hypothetical protein
VKLVVMLVEEIDQGAVSSQLQPRAGIPSGEVVDRHNRGPVPVAALGEDGCVTRVELRRLAPAELGTLSAAANQPLHPVEQRLGIASLACHVHLAKPERAFFHERAACLAGGGEAGLPVARPLHRRADAVASLDGQVLGHADLLAVEEDGRAR